ncbi:MAG: penicillin-insensitive murein endopeptidase [Syntrophobacteraceae bacterium]
MGGARTVRALFSAMVLTTIFVFSSLTFIQTCQALTISYGHPYQGSLENGVVFPNQFQGYHLRDESRSYTTPEVAGALLDAIEAVRKQFPDTCDVFLADFTCAGGGSSLHHRSHQNGRDVDVGLYAKGNRPLNGLVPMNQGNLDAAKTWCLIENLIASQRVQYIFLDRSVQKELYEYAVSRGYDEAYLHHVFGNVRGCLIQHIRNHIDHMHVRFFTPWSTLAAHIGPDEVEKQAVIEMAQQSYLPKKVNYYVSGSEKGLDELAKSFGVTTGDLCRWNHISPTSVLVPGSCLVFYKRSFESEPVMLARSLQPGFIAQAAPVRMASIQPEPVQSSSISDSTPPEDAEPVVKEQQTQRPVTLASTFSSCTAVRGDTIEKIARRDHLDVALLCRLNRIEKNALLKPGYMVRTSAVKIYAVAGKGPTGAHASDSSSSAGFSSNPQQSGSSTAAYYTMKNGGTLKDVSKKTGVPVSSLCRLNGLGQETHLNRGQNIKLALADLENAADTHKRAPSSSSVGFSSNPQQSGSATAAYYTMKNGGTLKDVSKKTGIPVSSLCRLNGLGQDTHLNRGQNIKLALADLENAADTHKRAPSSSSICFASDSKKFDSPTAAYYTVNSGGTLQDVSKKTGISLSSLCQLNGLARNARLKPGQRIKLTQANLRVKPSFGSAACSFKGPAKKPAAVKNDKSNNKPSKDREAEAAQQKQISTSRASIDSAVRKGHEKVASAKKPALKKMGKSGKPSPATAQKKTPDAGAKLKTAAKPGKNTAFAKK